VSGLVPGQSGAWIALSGEGGHVTLAATNALEAGVVALLAKRFGHASAERALSGAGLVNLYEAVCELEGLQAKPLEPAQVSAEALKGDTQATQAIALFAAFLGTVSGNLALTLGARGGLYVGGGIIPQLGALFDASLFRTRFESKGRFAEYLRPVPTYLITAANPALTGAARALDLA
jgi:glucokinase